MYSQATFGILSSTPRLAILPSIALVTIPGEAFTDIGVELKKSEGWDTVLIFGETDGCAGYFPTTEAFEEGGYEARSSKYRAGIAEILIQTGRELLEEIK